MKPDQACSLQKSQVQGRDIAVANKYFRVLSDQLIIDVRQEPRAAITTTGAPHCFDFRVGESSVQIFQALCVGSGYKAIFCPEVFARCNV